MSSVELVTLQSNLLAWVDSYRHLVEGVGNFAFGWIDLWWIKLSAAEIHVLVLVSSYVGLLCKTFTDKVRQQWTESSLKATLPLTVVGVQAAFIIADVAVFLTVFLLLSPDPVGWAAVLFALLLLLVAGLFVDSDRAIAALADRVLSFKRQRHERLKWQPVTVVTTMVAALSMASPLFVILAIPIMFAGKQFRLNAASSAALALILILLDYLAFQVVGA